MGFLLLSSLHTLQYKYMLPSLPAAKKLESNDFHIFAVAFEAMHLLEDLPAALRSAKNDKSSPVDK